MKAHISSMLPVNRPFNEVCKRILNPWIELTLSLRADLHDTILSHATTAYDRPTT